MTHRTTSVLVVAAAALALAGCSSAGASTTAATTSPTPTRTAPAASALPTGEPPTAGEQDSYPNASSVPGLVDAVAAADHQGLSICDGQYASIVTASGDLRGDGGTQYLVDTTCDGATASTPDEVAVYDSDGGSIARSVVLYEPTEQGIPTTAYPFVWKAHTVVLTYESGKQYRLVRLTPDGVVRSAIRSYS